MKRLILLLLAVSMTSCLGQYNDETKLRQTPNSETLLRSFDENSFEKRENLIGEELGIADQLIYPVSFTIHGDYAYILDDKSEQPLHIVNIKERKYHKSFSSKGYGPGELLAPFSIEVSKGKLWVYDLQLGQFQSIGLDKIHSPSTTHFDEYIKVENTLSCISPKWVDEDHFVSLNMEGDREGRLNFFNQEGAIDQNNGSLNLRKPSKDPNSILLQAYQGTLSMSPDKENIIISNLWTDRIEIFDKSGKTELIITGPDNFLPSYDILNGPGSSLIMGINSEARLGYFRSTASKKYIYALYSGDFPGSEGANQLFIFDKETGNALRSLTLNYEIADFIIAEDEKSFYALTTGSSRDIVKYGL